MEFSKAVDRWYFGVKTTRCARDQEAKLEIVKESTGNSVVVSHPSVILCDICARVSSYCL